MADEKIDPGSGAPLQVETIATMKQLLSPHRDSSYADTHTADGPKRKCGKKVRRKSGTKKHRAGKNQKRKYKPYYRLSAAERRKVDERNEKRNSRKREFLHSLGFSLAPHNTTQFLFEDRKKARPRRLREGDNSDLSSLSEYDGSETGGGDEFWDMWKSESNQRFQRMTDQELREYFVSLEDEIEAAERHYEDSTKIQIFQEEVRKSQIAIAELIEVNARLTKILEDVPCKAEKDVDKKDQPLESDSCSVDTGAAV